MSDEASAAAPPSAPAPAPKKKRSQLLVRLPLLLAIGLGIWLWRGGGGLIIAERQLVFRMPEDRALLKRFEFQLFDAEGQIVKRLDLSFSAGAPPDVTSRVQLKAGSHPLKLFRWYEGPEPRATSLEIAVGDEEQVLIDVPSR